MAFDAGAIEARLDLDRDPFQRGLRAARAEGEAFEARPLRKEVEVDIHRGTFTRLMTTIAGGLASAIGGAAGAGGAIFGGFMRALSGLPSLITGVALVIGVALLPALAALAASLATATVGLGILALGFAATLGPAILVAIALFSRFAAIIKARQEREQALTKAVAEQRSAEVARKAAAEAASAAHRRLAQAEIEANKARAQSVEDVRDAELALEGARLAAEGSEIAVARARKELREFLRERGARGGGLASLMEQFQDTDFHTAGARKAFSQATGGKSIDPLELREKIHALRTAQHGYKEAVEGTRDAENRLTEAQRTRAEFAEKGLAAHRPYAEALLAAQKADEKLAEAERRKADAMADYHRQLKKLSGTERTTLGHLDRFIKGFGRFAKIITDPIFRAFNSTIGSLSGRFDSLEKPMRRLGEAMGGIVRSFGRFVGERKTVGFMRDATNAASKLAGSLGKRAFTDFLRIMRNIAREALPWVVSAAEKVAKKMREWREWTDNSTRLRNRIGRIVEHLKTWWGVAKDLARVFISFIRGANDDGRSLADTISRWLRRLRRFLDTKEGRKELSDWIDRSVGFARNLAKAFEAVAKALEAVARAYRAVRDFGPRKWAQKVTEKAIGALGYGSGEGDYTEEEFRRDMLREQARRERLGRSRARSPRQGPRGGRGRAAMAGGGDVHFHVTSPDGGFPDPDNFMAKAERAARKRGKGRR